MGIQPDIIMLRSEIPVDAGTKEKLALFCNVSTDCIIQNLNAKSIYEVPLMMEQEGLGTVVCRVLGIEDKPSQLQDWTAMVDRFYHPAKTIRIALVGKYIELHDAYLSVVESLIHGGIAANVAVDIDWVDAEECTNPETTAQRLKDAQGIIVPGGFGVRGIEGMIQAAQYARTNKVPYFGICLGMQIQVIEFARNVLGMAGANSSEMDKDTAYPVIDLMSDQNGAILGGTLRLGKYQCALTEGSLAEAAYGSTTIWERHRHRYEFNPEFRAELEGAGLSIAGTNPQTGLVEVVELPNHPFFVGCQFHPEFKSRPRAPHPLFAGFVAAALARHEQQA